MNLRLLPLLAAAATATAASAADPSGNARDDRGAPPRLYLVQNYWGFDSLPSREKAWTKDEALAQMKAARFDAVDVWGSGMSDATADEWKALASKHGLGLGMEGGPSKVEDLPALIATARRLGSPYLDLHVASYFLPEKEAEGLLRALSDRCRAEGVAMVAQTHRGRVTQDLIRTVAYAKAIPALRFDLDFSHYFVAGEIGGTPGPEAMAHLEVLMERAVMLDGRVSNGEQVQIDLGPNGESDQTRLFAGLWKRVMVAWLKTARRGDLFPFRVELGPPNYAIRDPQGREISDRWEQQKLLGRLAERLWNEAVKETGLGEPHGG